MFTVGDTFERYAIEALIGRGGMGEVYRATDTRLRRKVALKVLRADRGDGDAVARLFREARSAAGLTHPNTVAIHDIGEADGSFYIVMELVVGRPLRAYVGNDDASLACKLGWLVDIARALSAAHRAGVIHRDVKPSNVMISDDGVVKVLDFGLAKPVAPGSFRTAQGQVLGTPRYMAPEQLSGSTVDARSDQYAFGVTAYELLAGQHPGGALAAQPARPLDEVASAISGPIARVLARALANAPSDRFESMADVVVALEDAAQGRAVRGLEGPRLAAATVDDTVRFDGTPATLDAPPAPVSAAIASAPVSTESSPERAAERAEPAAPAWSPSLLSSTLPSRDGPLPFQLVPPAPETLASSLEAAADTPRAREDVPAPRRPSNRPLIALALVVLGVCAFAGAYFGSRAFARGEASAAPAAHDGGN